MSLISCSFAELHNVLARNNWQQISVLLDGKPIASIARLNDDHLRAMPNPRNIPLKYLRRLRRFDLTLHVPAGGNARDINFVTSSPYSFIVKYVEELQGKPLPRRGIFYIATQH